MKITPSEDLRDWIVENFRDAAIDDISNIAIKFSLKNGWDSIEVDFMVDEIIEEIEEGILNVIDTYEEE